MKRWRAAMRERLHLTPVRTLGVAVVLTVLAVTWLGWNTWGMYRALERISTTEHRLQQLIGTIYHLDEVLTMSARMAAATGDVEWEQRYRRFEPPLDSAIKETINLAPEAYESETAAETDAANIKLVAMEQQAFDLVRDGDRDKARAILASEEYQRQKRIYSRGMRKTTLSIQYRVTAQIEGFKRRSFILLIFSFLCPPFLFMAWVAALQGVRTHIARRREAEEELEKERDFVSVVLDTAGCLAMVLDAEGRIVRFNRACERTTGLGFGAAKGKTPWELFAVAEEVETSREVFAEVVRSGRLINAESRWMTREGAVRSIDFAYTALRDDHESVEYIIATGLDVTERKNAEEDSRRAEQKYHSLLTNIEDAFYEVDLKGNFTFFNPALVRLVEYSEEELIGMSYQKYTDEETAEKVFQAFHGVYLSGEPEKGFVYEVIPKNSGRRIVEASVSLIRDKDNEPVGFQGVLRDITQRERVKEENARLEDQLRHTQKMEAIGTLAGGVAHDFNNLLTGILGYVDMLKNRFQTGSGEREAVDIIEKAAERASHLTKQLLGFARKGKLQNTEVDLHDTIEEVAALLGRTIDKKIRISKRLRASRSCVMGDPDQLQQVLLNLAVNARDAMPDGGDLIFETDNVEISGGENNQPENAKRGRCIRITVADTGCGIASDIQDRVFDPFFTAKKQGEGTGMGLAMVYGIVQNHEGSIDLDSEEGRGTRLMVSLPLTAGSPASAAAPEKIEPIRGHGRILVVDDEEVVRRLIDDLLTDLGYEVVTVDDGVEAVEYYKKFGKEIDLAIIDMVMPRMGGHECFRAFKEIDPEVRAILITGYGRDGAAQEILDEGMLGFAQKPFQGGQLSEVVASALAADAA